MRCDSFHLRTTHKYTHHISTQLAVAFYIFIFCTILLVLCIVVLVSSVVFTYVPLFHSLILSCCLILFEVRELKRVQCASALHNFFRFFFLYSVKVEWELWIIEQFAFSLSLSHTLISSEGIDTQILAESHDRRPTHIQCKSFVSLKHTHTHTNDWPGMHRVHK